MAQTQAKSERRTPGNEDRLVALETAFKDNPQSTATELAEAYLATGRPKDAIRVLNATPVNGKELDRHLLLAQAWFDDFDNGKSAELLNEAAKHGSLDKNLRAQLLLGELAFEAGRSDEAKKHLHRVLQMDAKSRRAAQLLQNLGEDVEVPSEAAEPEDEDFGFRTDDPDAESPKRAALQIAIGLVVGAVLFGLYYWMTQRSHAAAQLVVQAAESADSPDVAALKTAEAKFREALEYDGSNEFAISGLAEIYAKLWVDHGLDDFKDEALDFTAQAVDGDIEKAERFAAEMLVALGNGQPEAAVKTAQAVLEKGGVSEKIYWVMGLALRRTGDLKGGRDNLRRAFELKGAAAHYAAALGDAYEDDNDRRNAHFYWGRAYQANSNYVQAAARQLIVGIRQGDKTEAVETKLKAFDALPAETTGREARAAIELARAELFYREGNTAGALAALDKAKGYHGEHATYLSLRGKILLTAGKVNEGLAALKAALDAVPQAQRYMYELAESYARHEQAKAAVTLLRSQAEKLGEDAAYHVALGNAYLAAGDPKEAKAAFDKALEKRAEHPDALLGLGILAWQQRDNDKAREWFEKAAGARSTFPEVYAAVGMMFAEMGAAADGNKQLELAERQLLQQGKDPLRLSRFYQDAASALGKAKGGAGLARGWTEKAAALRKGG